MTTATLEFNYVDVDDEVPELVVKISAGGCQYEFNVDLSYGTLDELAQLKDNDMFSIEFENSNGVCSIDRKHDKIIFETSRYGGDAMYSSTFTVPYELLEECLDSVIEKNNEING